MSDSPETPQGAVERVATSLLDTLRVGAVMLDTDGRILLWSPTVEEILGWPGEQMVGRRYDRYLVRGPRHPGAAAPGGPRSGSRDEIRGIYETLRRERYWRGVLRVRHLDGRTVEVEGRASLLEGHGEEPFILANIVETTRLRAVEHDLAALDALFASSPLGVAIFDTEHRFVRVNEALARLSGRHASELVGRTVQEVFPRQTAQEITRIQSAVLRTGRSAVDVVSPAPGGRGWCSVSYSRLTDRAGRVVGVGCTVMDITERRDALEEIEQARQRLKLLDDVGVALGDLLDVGRISTELATSLVPRFADYAAVMLHAAVAQGGELARDHPAGTSLLQLGAAAKDRGPAVERMLRAGQDIALEPGSVFGEVLSSTVPHLVMSRRELLAATRPGDPGVQAALDLGVHSLMAVPLRARGIVLGLLVLSRADGRAAFDAGDLALTVELAGRAGISLDNARLYARERESALMLQRSLLPQHVPSPPGVRVAYRYVPGGSTDPAGATEAGGDWFDVIPLAGGRVAFVVGDVMGHGLRAAATMGRLRTAVRTLAGLDLPPDELLRRVDDLADDLAQGPDDPLTATCVYAVYDPSTRHCALARAGHVPPLVLTARPGGGWTVTPVEAPPGAPLGVGGVPFEPVDLYVEEGTVLALYTDGLIENRDEDITDGLDRFAALLTGLPVPPCLEDVCDLVLDSLRSGGETGSADDVALLLAQLGGLPEGSAVSWNFPAEASAVRRARELVRRTLHDWGLEAIADNAVLLVSELVTNSLRYAHGPIGLRMVRGTSLLVEVSDPLPDPPRERVAAEHDEGGRGIRLVARGSRRWGTRHGPLGKTVWFELTLP